jgi:hypothetical protein
MTLSTARLQIPYPSPGDAFKPASIDLPALAARLDAITARQPGDAIVSLPVLDVGQVGQIRAGRLMTLADFTTLLGLSAPAGLWNLGDTSDISGNARTLTNKGSVPFGVGINGAASSAAVFAGSTAQALYIADTGAGDTLRIKTGSWGCWFRTAKRGVEQALMSRQNAAVTQLHFGVAVSAANVVHVTVSLTGVAWAVNQDLGSADVADDRWHHVVVTVDGTAARLYVDGALDGVAAVAGPMFSSSAPLNIGAYGADGATAGTSPHFGRIDAAFVTPDVLTDDQVRLLYASKTAHAYAVAPTRAHLGVTRRRRGAALVIGDFPSTPLRLYNFTAAALTDAGANNVPLTVTGTGTITDVAGADGTRSGGQSFAGTHTGLASTDAGLPATTTSRSYGGWFKVPFSTASTFGLIGWGTTATADARLEVQISTGLVRAASGADLITGPYIADSQWHHLAVVEDNAAADGVKRKLYVDGRLVGGSTVLTSLTLAGANRFRIGAAPDGTIAFVGQADGGFVIGVALTSEQVWALYQKSGQSLGVSPKNEGDHVEALDATNVYTVFDTLDPQNLVDLKVAA